MINYFTDMSFTTIKKKKLSSSSQSIPLFFIFYFFFQGPVMDTPACHFVTRIPILSVVEREGNGSFDATGLTKLNQIW